MTLRVAVILCIALSGVAGFIWFSSDRASEHTSYATALRDAQVVETVVVSGKKFTVTEGIVSAPNGTPHAEETRAALKTAYALTDARFSPLFGIPGTDPRALTDATKALADALDRLANAQTSHEKAEVIRRLYPLTFLTSLSQLESDRKAFLASGSDTDAAQYHAQLATAVNAYEADGKAFIETFLDVLPQTPMRFPGAGGTITLSRLETAVRALEANIAAVRTEHDRRMACIGGTGACESVWITEPNMRSPEEMPLGRADEAERIMELWKEAAPPRDTTLVVLATSSCLATQPAPYFFSAYSTQDRFFARYAGDIFFNPTSGATGPTLLYLGESGIEYVLVNPLNYYVCPSALHDLGRIRAVMDVRVFARAHPYLAPNEAQELISNPVLSESSAVEFLKSARGTTSDVDVSVAAELTELILAFERRTAGLEFLIENIARVTRTDVALADTGVPFDLDARKVLLTHSAFPSLFLLHTDPLLVYEELTTRDRAALEKHLMRYSELNVSREEVIDDLRDFLRYEGRLD